MTTIALIAAAVLTIAVNMFFAVGLGIESQTKKDKATGRFAFVVSVTAGILALFFAYQAGVAR